VSQGRVLQLWRWPVKSTAGERVRSTRVDARGAGGDRTHAVLHEHKGEWKPLTAREAPRLLAWRAAYPFAPDAGLHPERPPYALVTDPDGEHSYSWDDPRLRTALTDDLGRPVRLRRDVAGIQDLERSLLITTEATRAALAQELRTELDLRRFRTNLHLELDAPAWAEHDWEGGTVRFAGGVVLRLLHPCVRCAIPTRDPETQRKWPELLRHLDARHQTLFGINARVLQAGRIAAGESVEVIRATGPAGRSR
jgi:MOSC domain-containing protein